MDLGAPTSEIGFTDDELQLLLQNLDQMTPAEMAEIDRMVDELKVRDTQKQRQDDLIAFCVHMMPAYLVGRHHRRLANLLMDIESGRKDRICVSVPPRHGKSQMASIFYAAWYLGKNPGHKVMLVSHTTDLAVDFGRKVRNIIASPEFQEVFPDIFLAADSKSAGRWSTNFGGEFFACISPDTEVTTQRGKVRAGEVRPGDSILSHSGYAPVHSVMRTSHDESVQVAGATYSNEHPIWTMNRGWVEAAKVLPHDVLLTESFLDTMQAIARRVANGFMEHADVPQVVQHKEQVRKPQQREVPWLRRAWNNVGREVASVSSVLLGHGAAALPATYSWADGQRRTLQPGELPVGDDRAAAEQQAQFRENWQSHAGATRTTIGIDPRGVAVSDVARPRCVESGEETSGPQGGGYRAVKSGRVRRFGAWLLARSGRTHRARQTGDGIKIYMESLREAAQNLSGVFLGVRQAGVVIKNASATAEFVNFRVGGDNTFFSDGVLTHNCGVGSALAGRGAHLLLIDDPHSEQDILNGNFAVFDKAYEWFAFGARTRLMPGGKVAIIHTRWLLDDLIGRVTRDMAKNPEADQYEVFEFPAILETDIVTPTGTVETQETALWPEFFDLEALHRTKASMPLYQWNAQYQQDPTSEEAAIVKRDWWRVWKGERPPQCEYLISSLDSAAEKHNKADFTSLTTWGVFFNDETSQHELILLNAIKDRFEFPELKQMCMDHIKEWEPDSFIVEKKSSGTAVYQELRRMGIAVSEYTPHRGSGDKYARLNAVSDMIASGLVWVPETRWADDLVDEIASFPYGSNDDQVDSSVMALTRFRQGGFIRLSTDYKDEPLGYQDTQGYY